MVDLVVLPTPKLFFSIRPVLVVCEKILQVLSLLQPSDLKNQFDLVSYGVTELCKEKRLVAFFGKYWIE